MATFWKRIVLTGGALLFLPGLLLAINSLCIAPWMALSGSNDSWGVMYGVASLTLATLTLGAGWVLYRHADQSLKGKPSRALSLPPLELGLVVFVFLLFVGLVITQGGILPGLFFPPVLLILAALPPLWAVSWFTPQQEDLKGSPKTLGVSSGLTWRRGLVAFCGGATVSVFLAILLEILFPAGILALVFTAGSVLDRLTTLFGSLLGPNVSQSLTSPAFVYVFVQIAVIAPLVDELVKPLVTLPLLRRLNKQETFWVGALAGAGFAAVENVIYAGGGFALWAGILLVRALGGALHPLGSGLVALGWRDVLRGEPNAPVNWVRKYALAVLVHAAWNGGSLLVITLGGAQFFGILPPEIGILGLSMAGSTLAFLFILGLAALWIGRAYGHNRPLTAAPEADADSASAAGSLPSEIPAPAPSGSGGALSERALALWGLACLLALVPMGIAGLKLWLH
ncbi:MAG: PrsW family glutamic-type intramembrane protease [Anaerolineales bacterium]